MTATSIVALLSMMSAGCSWVSVEDPPEYGAQSIPVSIGLVPAENVDTVELAAFLARELTEVSAFGAVIYPYRPDDPAACVLEINATSSWDGSAAAAGALAGATFGLAGAFVGPSITIAHDIRFRLTDGVREIGPFDARVESEVEWGIFADTREVAGRQSALQSRRIAIAIGDKFSAERAAVITLCTDTVTEEPNRP